MCCVLCIILASALHLCLIISSSRDIEVLCVQLAVGCVVGVGSSRLIIRRLFMWWLWCVQGCVVCPGLSQLVPWSSDHSTAHRWGQCVRVRRLRAAPDARRHACVYPHSTSTAGRWAVRSARVGRHLTALPVDDCDCERGARSRSAGRPSRTRTHCAAQPTKCQMPAPTPRGPGRAPIKVRHMPAGLLIRGSASPSVTDGRKSAHAPPCTRQAIPSRAWGCWSCWGCVRGCDCPWGRNGSCRGPGQSSTRNAAI
jgi:hypothetical protein